MIDVVKLAIDLDERRRWTATEKKYIPAFCYDYVENKISTKTGYNQNLALLNLLFTNEFLAEVFAGWRHAAGVQTHYRTTINERVVGYLEGRYLNRFKQTHFCAWSNKMFREINEIKSLAEKKKSIIVNRVSGTSNCVILDSNALKLWLSAWEELYRDFLTNALSLYNDKKNDLDFRFEVAS